MTILGGNDNDTIKSGNITYTNVPSPFRDTVTVVSTGGDHNLFDGGEGNDVISNHGKYKNAKNESGVYPLSSEPNHSTLLGGTGNDTLINQQGGSFSLLDGGTDNDSIVNFAKDVKDFSNFASQFRNKG